MCLFVTKTVEPGRWLLRPGIKQGYQAIRKVNFWSVCPSTFYHFSYVITQFVIMTFKWICVWQISAGRQALKGWLYSYVDPQSKSAGTPLGRQQMMEYERSVKCCQIDPQRHFAML